jgi:hypothetical protein
MSIGVEKAGSDLQLSEPRRLFSGLRLPPGVVRMNDPLDENRDGSRIYWTQGREMPQSDVINVKLGGTK